MEVRRGEDDDGVLGGGEAVELGEELVDRPILLGRGRSLVVAAAGANGVKLVNKDDARALLAGLGEELADALRAGAAHNLNKIRAAAAKEGHIGLTGDCLREQRLAGAGLAGEKAALREARAQASELVGVHKEVNVLLDLLLGLGNANNILEVGPLHIHLKLAAL